LADAVRVIRPDDVQWSSLEVDGAAADMVANVVAAPASPPIAGAPGFAAGFVDFRELEMDFTVTYDEACYVIEGEIHLTPRGEEPIVVRAGEVFEIHYDTDVHVHVPDRCRLFYAAYPVDWLERHEGELVRLGR
jgi:ethanolamine utilization protein EutQ (cupin superfamily)